MVVVVVILLRLFLIAMRVVALAVGALFAGFMMLLLLLLNQLLLFAFDAWGPCCVSFVACVIDAVTRGVFVFIFSRENFPATS